LQYTSHGTRCASFADRKSFDIVIARFAQYHKDVTQDFQHKISDTLSDIGYFAIVDVY
jgi:hypothetical protein